MQGEVAIHDALLYCRAALWKFAQTKSYWKELEFCLRVLGPLEHPVIGLVKCCNEQWALDRYPFPSAYHTTPRLGL